MKTVPLFLPLALLVAAPACAQQHGELLSLINAYRKAPATCDGRSSAMLPALLPHAVLASLRIGPATFLEPALERAGFPVEHAVAIALAGPADAAAAMAILRTHYCASLLVARFSAAGIVRDGARWQIVLAQPARPAPGDTLPGWQAAGRLVLDAVNLARATARSCGARQYAAAPPLAWNDALGAAALAHSQDMAAHRYFSHAARDGGVAGDRALLAGYRWRRVGENIAAGQESPAAVVAGWLDSPGHCANIMDPEFEDMGAAYAINPASRRGSIYWTQVFARAR
ncbi:MAG: CAP domain-containing protein [Pseudomonadota bacterium]